MVVDDAALERSAIRRISLRIVPFLMICYFVAFIDRVNLGFAGHDLSQDLHLSPTVFGFGAGLFFLAYFVFEVPSNLLLERFGARRWIARIMVTWGLVAAAMALMKGEWSFYLLRVLLGIAEAGFFPGVILYLTYWFPREHRAKVVGYFMVAIPVSTFLGSPVSGAILDGLAGVGGLRGWQWLFIIEAVPAILLGLAVLVWLPDRPRDAAWLPEAERDWLERRLVQERQSFSRGPRQSVWQIMADRRVLVLGLVYAGSTATNYGLSFWQPQLIKGFGMSNTMAGVFNAIPFLIGSVAMILWGRRSDTKSERVWHTAIALFVSAIGLAACLFVSGSLTLTLVALSTALVGCYALKGPFWALSTEWLAAGAAAAGIAQINALGNLAGFVGPFLLGWIKEMTGSYALGMLPMIALAVLGGIAVLANGKSAEAAVPHPAE
jgi:ACS family tartrate transporter-like MFS transporter